MLPTSSLLIRLQLLLPFLTLAFSGCCQKDYETVERFTRASRLENIITTGLASDSPEPGGDGSLFLLGNQGRPSDPVSDDSTLIISVGGVTRFDYDPRLIAEAALALDTDLRRASLGMLLSGKQFALGCQRIVSTGACVGFGEWADASGSGTATVVPAAAGNDTLFTLRLDLTIQPATGSQVRIQGTQAFSYGTFEVLHASGDCS